MRLPSPHLIYFLSCTLKTNKLLPYGNDNYKNLHQTMTLICQNQKKGAVTFVWDAIITVHRDRCLSIRLTIGTIGKIRRWFSWRIDYFFLAWTKCNHQNVSVKKDVLTTSLASNFNQVANEILAGPTRRWYITRQQPFMLAFTYDTVDISCT